MRRRYPLIADATRYWRGLSRLPGEWLPRAWEDGNPVFFLSSDHPRLLDPPQKNRLPLRLSAAAGLYPLSLYWLKRSTGVWPGIRRPSAASSTRRAICLSIGKMLFPM